MITQITEGGVELEFTGKHIASVSYRGGANRQYMAGNNIAGKFVTVHPDDAAHLVDSGNFRIADQPEAESGELDPVELTFADIEEAAKPQAAKQLIDAGFDSVEKVEAVLADLENTISTAAADRVRKLFETEPAE